MIDPKYDNCKPLRCALAIIDIVLVAVVLYNLVKVL